MNRQLRIVFFFFFLSELYITHQDKSFPLNDLKETKTEITKKLHAFSHTVDQKTTINLECFSQCRPPKDSSLAAMSDESKALIS